MSADLSLVKSDVYFASFHSFTVFVPILPLPLFANVMA